MAVASLNLRSGPSTDCDVLVELPLNSQVSVIGDPVDRPDYEWVPVRVDDRVGFVVSASLQDVDESATCGTTGKFVAGGEQGYTAETVNLRSGPGLGCAVVQSLGAGTPVTIAGERIDVDGETWLPVTTVFGNGYIYLGGYAAASAWTQPVAVAVLMYHDIGEPIDRYRVAPWQLEQQLIWLRDNGYVSITPRDLVANLDTGAPLPPKPVILSIDDGWTSSLIFRDLLAAYGFRGTYFLPNYAELSPETIWALNQDGEVCGHSVSHQFLDQLSYEAQMYEVGANKAWLDSIIGTSTTCFAYPFGAYNAWTTEIVANAGYRIAFDAWHGVQYFDPWMDRWHIKRIEVNGLYDLSTFAAIVSF